MRKIKSKMEFLKAKIDWVSSPSTSLTDCSCDNFCVGQHWKPVKATEESFQSKIHPQFRCRLSGNLDELERIKRPLKLLVLGFSNSTQTGHPGLGQHIHPHHCCIHSTFPATEKLENLPQILIMDMNWLLFCFLLVCRLGELPRAARGGWEQIPEAVTTGADLGIYLYPVLCVFPGVGRSSGPSSIIPADSSGQAQDVPLERYLNFRKLWEILAMSFRSRTSPQFHLVSRKERPLMGISKTPVSLSSK